MKTFRRFPPHGIALLLFCSFLAAAPPDQVLEFVHVTDTHVMKLDGVHPSMVSARRHYAHTGEAFERFLTRMKREYAPAFVLHTGDIIDAVTYAGTNAAIVNGQVENFKRIHDRSPLPLFLTLGNHDIQHYGLDGSEKKTAADQSGAARARAAWIRSIECFRDGPYYGFSRAVGKTRYRFLVLDNGYYGDPQAATGRLYDLGRAQLDWLRKQVEVHQGDVLILGMHVPMTPGPLLESIRAALAARLNAAIAFTGHTHDVDEIESLASDGRPAFLQVRTPAFGPNENHWRLVRLREDRIEISLTGDAGTTGRLIRLGPVSGDP